MITLRKETKTDYPGIRRINDIAFGRKAESRLIDLLRKKDEFVADLSIVAEQNEQLIGHILFTPIKIESGSESYQTLCLAPMSVLPEFQQKSIGKLLVIQGLQVAKDLGYNSVVVLGHPSFYPKFGFEPASKWGIKSPFPAPDEAFMAIELFRDCLKKVNGKVVFPPEFDDL